MVTDIRREKLIKEMYKHVFEPVKEYMKTCGTKQIVVDGVTVDINYEGQYDFMCKRVEEAIGITINENYEKLRGVTHWWIVDQVAYKRKTNLLRKALQ
jgi:hypothetical protein